MISRLQNLICLENIENRLLNKVLKVLLIGVLIAGWGFEASFAQNEVQVMGTVTDASDGTLLPGVNITVQGMPSVGTTTNIDGEYSLDVPEGQNVLLFSFVGFVTQEIEINDREVIDVELQPDIQLLDDVVVIGYGSQERRQITGSVTSVREEEFVKGAINDSERLLQGKVPGLTIVTQQGNPNGQSAIRLRGVSSFGENQEPLIVVDGVLGANLQNIDPNDIESMEVLKDASASAIYGTRGSAGVILVTTKRGTPGDISISYNGYVTADFIERERELLSANEWRDLAESIGKPINDLGANTDWIEEITQTGLQNVHSLSLSGGAGSTTWRLSANFRDVDGIQLDTGFQRLNGRLNLTQKALDDMLTVNILVSGTDRESDRGFPGAFAFASNFNPSAPVNGSDIPEDNPNFREDGFAQTGGFVEFNAVNAFNPLNAIKTAENTAEEKNFNGAIRATYDFDKVFPGLSGSVFYSLETNNIIVNQFAEKTNKSVGGAVVDQLGPGNATQSVVDNSDELFEATVSYVTDISSLNIDVVSGYSWNNIINEGFSASGGDFIADAVGVNNFTFAQDFDQGEGNINSFKDESTIVGGFGRVSLRWDDTYFFNGSARREGSTRFGSNNKYGTFWAAGGGIEFSNLIDIPKVNSLRIRASYGKTGQNAPEVGLSQLRFGPLSNFFANGSFVQSFGPVSNPNPDLKWEEKKEFNLGLDYELFNSRVTGTVEYYDQDTDDLIFPIEVSVPPNIFPTTFRNIGSLESTGVELSISVNAINRRDLNWTSTMNSTVFGDTKLADFISEDARFFANPGGGLNTIDMVRVKSGEEIGQIWGPKFSRFAIEEDVQNLGLNLGEPVCIAPDGEELFSCRDSNREREQVLGNGLPEFQIGWTNNLNYRNFDFNLFVRGVFGHDLADVQQIFNEPLGLISNENRLTSSKKLPPRARDSQPFFSSFQVDNAGFIRIENLTLGYTFPLKSQQINRLRVYFSGNNLFTITDYNGVDPEPQFVDTGVAIRSPFQANVSGGNALAAGIDRRNNFFLTRSFTLGVNLDF